MPSKTYKTLIRCTSFPHTETRFIFLSKFTCRILPSTEPLLHLSYLEKIIHTVAIKEDTIEEIKHLMKVPA
jgi:hypothetical protein